MILGSITGSPPGDARRGQSATMAIVLLFGVVALGSLGILMVANETVSGIEHQSEEERIQQAFVELSQRMATASVDDSVSHSMDFEAGESGAVTKTNAGTIRIEADGVDETLEMGAIEYESDDGTIVAYQAGGVWRETGNETQMVSAPPVQYDTESETLTLPIATVSGQQDLTSGGLTISHNTTNPIENASVVEDDTVTLTITSDYYLGWKSYFETQAGDTVVRDVDHDNRTVTVLLGYAEIETAFNSDASYTSDFHDQHGHLPRADKNPFPPMDEVIDQMVADAKDHEEVDSMDIDKNLSEESYALPLSDGTYFIEEINENDELEFNISEGNATLIVEGDVNVGEDGEIRVTDWKDGNSLKIYSAGDRFENDGEVCVENCNEIGAEYIQLYGKSTMGVDFGPSNGGTFEGLLYVASDEEMDWWDDEPNGKCGPEHQVLMQANGVDVYGSIVAYSICAHSNGMEFEYDEDLQDADIDVYPEEYPLPPQITYLNIVVHEMDVENK